MCVRASLGIICLKKHQVILGTAHDAKQKYKNSGTMLPAVGQKVNVLMLSAGILRTKPRFVFDK